MILRTILSLVALSSAAHAAEQAAPGGQITGSDAGRIVKMFSTRGNATSVPGPGNVGQIMQISKLRCSALDGSCSFYDDIAKVQRTIADRSSVIWVINSLGLPPSSVLERLNCRVSWSLLPWPGTKGVCELHGPGYRPSVLMKF